MYKDTYIRYVAENKEISDYFQTHVELKDNLFYNANYTYDLNKVTEFSKEYLNLWWNKAIYIFLTLINSMKILLILIK